MLGFLPRALTGKELEHRGLTELVFVETMHERKARMADAADAFVALPGGFGTLDETFEVLTWSQLGIQRKPIGLLDVNAYFGGLLAFLDHAAGEGFVRQVHRALLHVDTSPASLLESLATSRPQMMEKWLRDEER